MAIKLLSEDELTDVDIAARVGVSQRALAYWKIRPEFDAEFKRVLKNYRARIMGAGYALKENRVKLLNGLIEDQLTLKKQRGAHPKMADPAVVPGGKTGLVTLEARMVGDKPVVEQFFDAALVASVRQTLAQLDNETKAFGERGGADRLDELLDAVMNPIPTPRGDTGGGGGEGGSAAA